MSKKTDEDIKSWKYYEHLDLMKKLRKQGMSYPKIAKHMRDSLDCRMERKTARLYLDKNYRDKHRKKSRAIAKSNRKWNYLIPEMKKLRSKGWFHYQIAEHLSIKHDIVLCTSQVRTYLLDEKEELKLSNKRRKEYTYNKNRNINISSREKRRSRLYTRIYNFSKRSGETRQFTSKMLEEKFYNEQDGKCYLTGDPIDFDSLEFNLDHIIPFANGGNGSLENCGVTTEKANMIKSDATFEELEEFCVKFLTYNRGYKKVSK